VQQDEGKEAVSLVFFLSIGESGQPAEMAPVGCATIALVFLSQGSGGGCASDRGRFAWFFWTWQCR
jgi:hypothetical protein